MSMTRRSFMGATAVGAALVASGVAVAEEAAPAEAKPSIFETYDQAARAAKTYETLADVDLIPMEDVAKLRDAYIDGQTEYVCSDGTVIPAVYVKLRALVNSWGIGMGSIVHDTAFNEVMYLFPEEEDAAKYLELPRNVVFNAYDYSIKSGRPVEECEQILEDFADRGLVMGMTRGGVRHYHQLGEAHGFWEFGIDLRSLTDADPENGIFNDGPETAAYTVAHSVSWGPDITANLYDSYVPFFYPVPVSKEVLAESENGVMYAYDDIREVFDQQTVFAVSPCQCRMSHKSIGTDVCPDTHPLDTCLSTGEMAEWYIEKNLGRALTKEEALAVMERSINAGLVMQSVYTKDSEVICFCHADHCDILGSYQALGGEFGNTVYNASHYALQHDAEACIKCGVCVDRCPTYAIQQDEEGMPFISALCIGCGQCGLVCPVGARKLALKDSTNFIEPAKDLIGDYLLEGQYRWSMGRVF